MGRMSRITVIICLLLLVCLILLLLYSGLGAKSFKLETTKSSGDVDKSSKGGTSYEDHDGGSEKIKEGHKKSTEDDNEDYDSGDDRSGEKTKRGKKKKGGSIWDEDETKKDKKRTKKNKDKNSNDSDKRDDKIDARPDDKNKNKPNHPFGNRGDQKQAEQILNDGLDPKNGTKCYGHGKRVPLLSTGCKQFAICNAGTYVLDKCAEGSIFDVQFGSCNLPHPGACKRAPGTKMGK